MNISEHNFALVGKFNNSVSQIAFITRDESNQFYLFEHNAESLYSWTRWDFPKYSQNEAIHADSFDIDSDGFDEIILQTIESIIILDYNISTSKFDKLEFKFSEWGNLFSLNVTSSYKFSHNPTNILIGNDYEIYSLFFNSETMQFEYQNTIEIPYTVSKIQYIEYGAIHEEESLLLVSNKEILVYNFNSNEWIKVFETLYQLVNKVVISNLDIDPENEIIFGVYGYNGGLDVVKANFEIESSQWRFVSTMSYNEIVQIYDLVACRLNNEDYGSIIISHDKGIDTSSVIYVESTQDLNVSTDHNMDNFVEQDGLTKYIPVNSTDTNMSWKTVNGELHYLADNHTISQGSDLNISADQTYELETNDAITYGLSPNLNDSSVFNPLMAQQTTLSSSNEIIASTVLNPYSGGYSTDPDTPYLINTPEQQLTLDSFGLGSYTRTVFDVNNGFFTPTTNIGIIDDIIAGFSFVGNSFYSSNDFRDYNGYSGTLTLDWEYHLGNEGSFPMGFSSVSGSGSCSISGGAIKLSDKRIKHKVYHSINGGSYQFIIKPQLAPTLAESFRSDEFAIYNALGEIIAGLQFVSTEYDLMSEIHYWEQNTDSWEPIGWTQDGLWKTFKIDTHVGGGLINKYYINGDEFFSDLCTGTAVADNIQLASSTIYGQDYGYYGNFVFSHSKMVPNENVAGLTAKYYQESTLIHEDELEPSKYEFIYVDGNIFRINYQIAEPYNTNSYISRMEIVPNLVEPVKITGCPAFEMIANLKDDLMYPSGWNLVFNDMRANEVSLYNEIEYDFGTDFIKDDFLKWKTIIPLEIDFEKFNLIGIFGSHEYFDNSELAGKVSINYDIDFYNGSEWIRDSTLDNTIIGWAKNIVYSTNNGTYVYKEGLNSKIKIRVILRIIFTNPSSFTLDGEHCLVVKSRIGEVQSERYIYNGASPFQQDGDSGSKTISVLHDFPLMDSSELYFNMEASYITTVNAHFEISGDLDLQDLYSVNFGNKIKNLPIKLMILPGTLGGQSYSYYEIKFWNGNQSVIVDWDQFEKIYLDCESSGTLFGSELSEFEIIFYTSIFYNSCDAQYSGGLLDYQIEFSLWDQETSNWDMLNALESQGISLTFDTPETKIDILYGQEDMYGTFRGYDNSFEFYIDDREVDVSQLTAFEIGIEGTVNHYISDLMSTTSPEILKRIFDEQYQYDIFDVNDHPMDEDSWVTDNNGNSFLQIFNHNTGLWENITISKYMGDLEIQNGNFVLGYYINTNTPLIDYGIYKNHQNFLYFDFRFIIDHHDFIESYGINEISNYLKVDIDKFTKTMIILNDPDDINNFQEYYGQHDFMVELPSAIPESLVINTDLNMKVNITDINQNYVIPANNEEFVWTEPQALYYLQNAETGEYRQVSSTPVIHLTFDELYAYITISMNIDLYSYNQFSEFLQPIDSEYYISGYIETSWKFLNNRINSVLCNITYIGDVFATSQAISWEREYERITDIPSENIQIGDIDHSGSLDIVMGGGSAILTTSNQLIYEMKLTAIDDITHEIICDQFFLASLTIGKPAPKFYEFLDGNIPEFGEIFVLNFVDFDFNHDMYSLEWSTDGINYQQYNAHANITIESGAQNYFSLNINSLDWDGLDTFIPEGDVYFRIWVKEGNNYGYSVLHSIIDRTPPITTLNFSHISGNMASLSTDFTFGIIDSNNISFLNVFLYDGEDLLNSIVFSGIDLVSNEITGSLLTALITEDFFSIPNFIIKYQSVDKAGNVEDLQEVSIQIDQDININLYSDGTYVTEIIGDLELSYGDFIYGVATDSFYLPLPLGTQLDLELNNLTYIRTEITDTTGKFCAQILSADIFSEDLRYLDGVLITSGDGYGVEFDQEISLKVKFPNTDRIMEIDGLKRFFPYSSQLSLEYDAINLNGTIDITSFEGFRIFLILPSVFNTVSGGTYTRIDFNFYLGVDCENETIIDSFTYSLNSDRIVELLKKNPNQKIWSDMLVSILSINIPFYELSQLYDKFNPSLISKIKITGIDNHIHPEFIAEDPTYSYQALGCAGIYLLDQINNATLYYETNPTGEVFSYEMQCKIHDSVVNGINVNIQNTLIILPVELSFNTIISNDTAMFGDFLTINNITLNLPYSEDVCGINADFLFLSATNHSSGEIIDIGMQNYYGIKSTTDFIILATPYTYTDLTLNFTGNALFESTTTVISSLFTVQSRPTLFDLATENPTDLLDFHVERNAIRPLSGLLLTEDRYPLIDNFDNSQEITFYHFENNQYIANSGDPKQLPESVIILNINFGGTYYPIDYAFLHGGEFFQFDIDSSENGCLNRLPGTYILSTEFLGTEFYAPTKRIFTVSIDPTDVAIEIREGFADDWQDNSSTFITEFTYTDAKNFEVRIEDLYERDIQAGTYTYLENTPVWCEIGLIPNSPNLENMDDNMKDCWGDYLALQNSETPQYLMFQYYKQDLGAKSILYPYYDKGTNTFKTFSPLYYQMGVTDSDGIAEFSVHGNVTINIAQDYYEKLDYTVSSLDSIIMYMRVFYVSQFDASFMQIPEYSNIGDTYKVDLYDNAQWVYDSKDDLVEILNNPFFNYGIYADPYHNNGWLEGKVHIKKEDTMISVGIDDPIALNFSVSSMVIEADIVNDVLVPEEDQSDSNFISQYGLRFNDHTDSFAIELQIYNRENTSKIIDGVYNHEFETYSPYVLWCDEDALNTFPCNNYLFGPQMDRLIPGYYNVRISPVITESSYYNEPKIGYGELELKGPDSYRIDAPSHLYTLYDFITYDPATNVIWTNSTGSENYAVYDSNYPLLTGTMEVDSSAFLSESYNFTDTIIVDVLLNDLKYDSFYIDNCSEWNEPFDFVFPLKFMHNQELNLTFQTRFEFNPEANIDYTYYEGLYIANASNFDSVANATNWDYWDAFIEPVISDAWDNYAPFADYQIKFSNLQIEQSQLYHNGQTWAFQKDLVEGSDRKYPYMLMNESSSDYWTHLDGKVQNSVIFLNVSIGDDDSDAMITTNFNASEIVIGFDKSSVTDWVSHENHTFSAIYDFRNLFTVEMQHWNNTDLNLDYQMDTGFQFENYYENDEDDEAYEKYSHSVRTGFFDKNDKLYDTTYFGLYNNESAAIISKGFFMPWQGEIDLQVLVPKFAHLDYSDFEFQVDIYLEELYNEENNHYNSTTILTTTDTSDYSAGYPDDIWKDLSIKFPSQFHSRMVNMQINVSIINSAESQIIPIYLISGYVMGQENIISVSSAYPEKLRARMFSTNYLYFFTEYGYDIGLEDTTNDLNDGHMGINDAYFELLGYNGSAYGVSDIKDILNVKDERSWVLSGFENGEWDYPTLSEENVFEWFTHQNYTLDKRVPNYDTYLEFGGENDSTGKTMATLKFNETVFDDIESPEIYSGFISISDCYWEGQSHEIREHAANTRKLTVFVYPAFWNQSIEKTGIRSSALGTPRNGIQTSLGDSSIDVKSSNEAYSYEVDISYLLDPSEEDIVINKWSDRFYRQGTNLATPANTDDIDENWFIEELPPEEWKDQHMKIGPWTEPTTNSFYEDDTYKPYDERYLVDWHNTALFPDFQFNVTGKPVSTSQADSVTISYRFGVKSDPVLFLTDFSHGMELWIGNTRSFYVDEISDFFHRFDFTTLWVEGEYTVDKDSYKWNSLFTEENGEYASLPISFRTVGDVYPFNEAWIYIDYIRVNVNNKATRLYWDDRNSLTYQDLFSLSHQNPDSYYQNIGPHPFKGTFNITDTRNLLSGVSGFGSTELLTTEISNWKRSLWVDANSLEGLDYWHWDEINDYNPEYGNEIEQDIVVLDFDQPYNIYGQPISQTSDTYEYLKIPIYLLDAQNITEVFITISYSNGPSDFVYLNISSEIGKSGIFYHDLVQNINFKRITNIEFDFRFNENAVGEVRSTLGLGGLALFTPISYGILTVETNASSYDYNIYPTVFSSPAIPETTQINLEFSSETETIEKLFIQGTEGWTSSPTEGEIYGSDLDLFSISLIENYNYQENETELYNLRGGYILEENRIYKFVNRTTPNALYYFDFDQSARNLNRKMTDWYRPSPIEFLWVDIVEADTDADTERETGTFHEKIPWINQYSLDFDGDARYDLIIEEFDGEAKGDFENNIQDYFRMDYGADGLWDYQILYDTQDYVVQASDPELYGMSKNLYGEDNGHYYLFNLKRELVEISYDTDYNGAFDFKTEIFYSMQSFALPEYRRMQIIDHDLMQMSDLFWHEPVQGVKYSSDSDGDGYFEETMERTDRWENSDWVLDDMYEELLFETYSYSSEDLDESDNMLIENTSFYLCGPDVFLLDANNFIQFDRDGNILYNRTEIYGDFIFEYDVKVPIDPRYNRSVSMEDSKSIDILPELLCDEHGVLAWYDTGTNGEKDGKMDIAFVFTEESWSEDRMAIGIYYCKSGSERVQTDSTLFQKSGDQFLPLHWLSASYNYSDFMGLAWKDSKTAYYNQLSGFIPGQGNSFTAQYYMDLLSGVAIMGGSSAVGAGVGVLFGTSLPGIVTFVGIMAAYTYYQYWVRPSLIESMAESGKWGMEAEIPEWDASPDDTRPWDAFWYDATDWLSYGKIKFSEQSILFRNTNIWYTDTEWLESREPTSYKQVTLEIPLFGIINSETDAVLQWINDWGYYYGEGNEFRIPDIKNFEKWKHYNEVVDILEQAYQAYCEDEMGMGDYHELYYSIVPSSGEILDITGEIGRDCYDHFWRDFASAEDPEHENQIGQIEDQISSSFGYNSVEFGMDSSGRPMFVPVANSNRNLSDPIQKEIDYLEMCFLSCYWKEFEAFRTRDPSVLAIQFGLQVIQTAAGVLASNIVTKLINPAGFAANYNSKGKWWLDFGKEILEETVIEESVSNVAYVMGASTGLSNLLGESLGTFSVVSAVTGKVSVDTTQNYINVYEQLSGNKYTPSSSLMSDSYVSYIAHTKDVAKAKVIETLHQYLQQTKGSHIISKMRSNTHLLNTIQSVINSRMLPNIDLSHTLDILTGLKTEKFHPERIKVDDLALNKKMQEVLWTGNVEGGGLNDLINSYEFHEKFGMVDPTAVNPTTEDIDHTAQIVSIVPGVGIKTYYSNLVSSNGLNWHKIEYSDGRPDIWHITPDDFLISDMCSESIGLTVIDPELGSDIENEVSHFDRKVQQIFRIHPNIPQSLRNNPEDFDRLSNREIRDKYEQLLELNPASVFTFPNAENPLDNARSTSDFIKSSIQDSLLMLKFLGSQKDLLHSSYGKLLRVIDPLYIDEGLSLAQRFDVILEVLSGFWGMFPSENSFRTTTPGSRCGDITDLLLLELVNFNKLDLTHNDRQRVRRDIINLFYAPGTTGSTIVSYLNSVAIRRNANFIKNSHEVRDWFSTFLYMADYASRHSIVLNIDAAQGVHYYYDFLLNFFSGADISEIITLDILEQLMVIEVETEFALSLRQFNLISLLNTFISQPFDMFLGLQYQRSRQIMSRDGSWASFFNLFIKEQYQRKFSTTRNYVGREYLRHYLDCWDTWRENVYYAMGGGGGKYISMDRYNGLIESEVLVSDIVDNLANYASSRLRNQVDLKIDIVKFNPATQSYEVIREGSWGHGQFELEMNKLKLTTTSVNGEIIYKVDQNGRYCGVLTDEDGRSIFAMHQDFGGKYALRFKDTYGFHILHQDTRGNWYYGQEHSIFHDDISQTSFSKGDGSGRRVLDGAEFGETLDEATLVYLTEKDGKAEISMTVNGLALAHVCKDGSNQYAHPLGTNHLNRYRQLAGFIGKYTPLITDSMNRILKGYMKGYFAIDSQTKNSGEFSKKLAIQYMSKSDEFISLVMSADQKHPKYLPHKTTILNLIIDESGGVNINPSEPEIENRLNDLIDQIQRAYGWNPSTQSWTDPNINPSNGDYSKFVANTQGYWYYYENAYTVALLQYDVFNHRVIPGQYIENKMYHYMMIGSALTTTYSMPVIDVSNGNVQIVVFGHFDQYVSNFGTTFVQGDANGEYLPPSP